MTRLEDAPARWLFAEARITSPSAGTLAIRLPYSWRRFPYALTVVGAAPRFVPGPFELVSGTKRLVVLRREGLTLQFRRLAPRAAVREFRRGMLDEAPVPLGDIVATKADRQIGRAVTARTLLGIDNVAIGVSSDQLRRTYWQTANRGDYEELIPELTGSAAYGFLGGEKARPADVRRARDLIPSLQPQPVSLGVPPDPALRYGARLLYAHWRDVGLGPIRLVSDPGSEVNSGIERTLAAYPQEEAIPAELVLRNGAGSRDLLLRALRATQQSSLLERLDDQMRSRAAAIPIAWVVDARLVSPRLEGWREDALGSVDYSEVRSRASSRRP